MCALTITLPPNHSLNLTEPAVDEFNARGAADTMSLSIDFRAPGNDATAARCRRLARIVRAQQNCHCLCKISARKELAIWQDYLMFCCYGFHFSQCVP